MSDGKKIPDCGCMAPQWCDKCVVILSGDSCHEAFDAWDEAKHVLSYKEGAVWKQPHGTWIKDVLDGWTVCPIGNASCEHYASLQLYAYHPELRGKLVEVMLCPLGISGDGERCPHNK